MAKLLHRPLQATLLATLAMAAMAAIPALAGTAVLCTGTVEVTFSPPLTNTAQSTLISVTESHNPCTHVPAGGLPFLMSAHSSAQVSRMSSCSSLLTGGPGSSLVQWSNGDTSTYNWNASASFINGNILVLRTGTVTSGRYAGESTSETLIESPALAGNPDFLTACSTTGVPKVTGTYLSNVTP